MSEWICGPFMKLLHQGFDLWLRARWGSCHVSDVYELLVVLLDIFSFDLNKWVYLNNIWSDEQKHIHYLKKSNFSRILNAECVYIVQWEWPDSGSAAGVIKMLLVTLVSAGNIIISLSAWLCTIYFCAVTKYRPPRSHSSLHQQTTFQGTTLFLSWWL